jgi:hypothetical protein
MTLTPWYLYFLAAGTATFSTAIAVALLFAMLLE